jgi:hypothetical protein
MKYFPIILLLSLFSILHSQYPYPDQPLGSRIERQDFFFVPNDMIPFDVEEFSTALPGVVDHPLLHLAINPASLHSIGNDPLLYFDYRTNKEIERQYYYVMPMWDMPVIHESRMIVPPYPYYPNNPSRLSIEPSFSTAILSKLFPESVPEWTLGATYELISQTEPYYPLEVYDPYSPYPLYFQTSNDSKSYYGVDFVRNQGHLFALYSAYRFNDAVSAGIRFGGTLYKRNAERGPIISDFLYIESDSRSFYDDNRLQDHSLFDFTAGIQWTVAEHVTVGASAGYIAGTLTQFEDSENSYAYESFNGATVTYRSQSLTTIDRKWENNGDGFTAGLQTTVTLSPSSSFVGTYSFRNHLLHLTVRANDVSGYTYSDDSQSLPYVSSNLTQEYRNGKGREYGYFHRGSLAYVLNTEKNVRLSIGVVLTARTINRNTLEGIAGSAFNGTENSQQPYTTTRTKQSKDLFWDYDEIRTETQIPLMLTLPLGPMMDLQFGINRRFISAEQKQQTITHFHRIESYRNDTLLTVEENRRFMNTYPSRNSITNTMAVLFGLTIHPADLIDIHIAGVPYAVNNDTHFQWMAGINVRP